MCITEQNSQKIRNLSIVAAVLVVIIHVPWPNGVPGVWVRRFLSHGFAQIAVPFFFAVSGYLLAVHIDEKGWYRQTVLKRFFSLFIPYFIWAGIGLVVEWGWRVLNDGTCLTLRGVIVGFGLDLSAFPLNVPLWYVRCLLLFVVFSPIAVFCIRSFPFLWGAALFLGWMFVDFRTTGAWRSFFEHGFSLMGLFYFSVGIFLFDKRKRVQCVMAWMGCKGGLFSLICGCLFLLLNIFWPYFNGLTRCVMTVCLLYSMWYYVPTTKWPSWISSGTFSIFVMHYIVLRCCESVFSKQMGMVCALISFGVGCVFPLLFVLLGKILFPSFLRICTGGRA